MPHALRIGGFVPFTSIDYPEQLSAVVFCQGCPWRCSYCHNQHLLTSRTTGLLDWHGILKKLHQRQGLLDAVVFSGGEPTLQKSLHHAMEQVRVMGFKVGLHTAGCYPERLKSLLPLVDWVGLDIKDLPENYPSLTGSSSSGGQAWQSLDILLSADVPFQVRTTVHPGMTEEQVEQLRTDLSRRGVTDHSLQVCRY
ncbi:anaerobic ribonucleoside-triphosphate reductase activating protein [Thiolapillus sp.]